MLIEQKTYYTIGAKVPFVPVAAQTGAATAAVVKNIKIFFSDYLSAE